MHRRLVGLTAATFVAAVAMSAAGPAVASAAKVERVSTLGKESFFAYVEKAADQVTTPSLIIPSTDRLGSYVEIRYRDVYFGDMHIFEHWRLINEPAMLIGMDALGLFDTLIIDYRRHELQIRMRSDG